jgi:hypothetical protein
LSEIAIGEQRGGVEKIQDEVFTHKVRLLEPIHGKEKMGSVVQAISQ